MASSLSRVYSDTATSGYSFGVEAGYSKGGVGPSTTHLYYYRDDCWLDGGDCITSKSSEYP